MTAASHQTPTAGERAATRISISQLWVFVAVVLPVVTVLEARISTVDLAYHVRAGEIMLRSHELIRTDTFTFTAAGRPWLDQQWGAQVVLSLLHRAGGWATLALGRAALVGILALFVYLACRAAGSSMRTAAWLTLASFILVAEGLAMRPQLIGLSLFALTLWLVSTRRVHPRRMWLVPVVVAAWANLHGSFALGPIVTGLAYLEDRAERSPRARTALWVTPAALAATLVNPFGPRVWSYAIGLSTNPEITRNITEWAAPTVRDYTGAMFFLSAAAAAGFLALRGQPARWPSLVTLGVFFALGLAAGRGAFWWGIVAPVVVARSLPAREHRGASPADPTAARLNAVIATILVALGVSFLPWWRDLNPLLGSPELLSDAPSGATSALERALEPGDRLFAPQRLGSWFELALPENPVFVDSRIEVFSPSTWRRYREVVFGQEGWQEVLDRWNVVAVVVTPDQTGILPRMREDPAWRSAYRDDEAEIFLRA